MWRSAIRGLTTMEKRLKDVPGLLQRKNDLIYCSPLDTSIMPRSTIIFFPGDVQSYSEIMEKDAENSLYIKWNLIDVAKMLRSYYKSSHIIVVKPSRMEFDIYSCYDNFVECDKFGVPAHDVFINACAHLEALLMNAAQCVIQEAMPEAEKNVNKCFINDENVWKPDETDITLIGFSKGCVVLNQLVYEICRDTEINFLKKKINCITWLDGGHGGTSRAWITETNILNSLASFPWRLRVEVTPYQVQRREWVKKEEQIFSRTLLECGADIQRRLHFASSPPSLLNHFRLLDEVFSHT